VTAIVYYNICDKITRLTGFKSTGGTVAESVYLVFSKPPEGMSLADFGEWYEQHVRDILTVEGFVAARRFGFDVIRGDTSPTMYSHLALYVIGGNPHAAMDRLAAADVPIPDWFYNARWASFYGAPLEGPIDLDRLDHAYLVFSRQPLSMGLDEFTDWYATHARENCTAEGFEDVWRYRLEPDTVDPLDPCASTHVAIYEVHGELPELRAALKEAADAGRVGFPEWFDDILFASLDAKAVSQSLAGVSA
jgi:hypothetical protein